jgi:membrane-associated phospholipid phosphatase
MTRPFAGRTQARRQEAGASVTGPEPGPENEFTDAIDPGSGRGPTPASPRVPAIILVAAGLTFAALSTWIAKRGSAVPAVDEQVHRWALAHRDHATVVIARAVRWGGITEVVLVALFVVGAATAASGSSAGRRLRSGLLLAAIAGSGIATEIGINRVIERARPPVSDWAGSASGWSFPSGHTTAGTLFAVSCAWALAARVPPGWPRRGVWAGGAAYAATVGWSRVWLGVHWPTDVLGGWLFGTAWLAGSVTVILILRRGAVNRALRGGQPPG